MAKPFFLAVGQDGLRLSSEDGVTWGHAQTGKEGETYTAAAFGNGVGLVVGRYGGDTLTAVTTDGVAWTATNHKPKPVPGIRSLVFGNGAFLGLGGDPGAVGLSKPYALFSKDGVAWSAPTDIGGKNMLRRVAWGGGRVVAVGDRGRRAGSADGKAWQDAPAVKALDTLVDVAFGNGVFVGVGLHGLRMATTDGVTWTARQTGEEGEHLNSVLFAAGKFVAVGAGATYTSADGAAWERTPNENAPQVAAWGNGAFVGAAWKGRLLASADGVKWREVFKADRHVHAVAWGAAG